MLHDLRSLTLPARQRWMGRNPLQPRLLILETSHRIGRVALAEGERILGELVLDETRRHTRDLVPSVRDLLGQQGWRVGELQGVIVSRGPGSYTGLRVGIISATTLAYATGCRLLAVDTFAAIARQAPVEEATIDVIADAQKDKLYVQRFAGLKPLTPLAIAHFDAWKTTLPEGTCVIGPGLEKCSERLPGQVGVAPRDAWHPRAESLLHIGLERLSRGESDDPFAVEPLYLRPSSAEEQWQART